MVLRRIFGDRAPHKHIQSYPSVSESWMQREQERLEQIAIDLGIDTRITRHRDEIEIEFNNVKDSALMRLRSFGRGYNPGQHIHEENFEAGDEAYRDAYLIHAQAAIDEMRLACCIERHGNQVYFQFDTIGEHALFTERRDRAVFHHLAVTDIGGPTSQP